MSDLWLRVLIVMAGGAVYVALVWGAWWWANNR